MNTNENNKKINSVHHANVVLGGNGREVVFDILKKDLDFKTQANPDFWFLEKDSLGIDDARDLGRWAIGKPLSGPNKVAFLVTKSITSEAQNALLKVLEEPTLGTYIFINLENLGGILPTFISRIKILKSAVQPTFKEKSDLQTQAQDFLKSNIKNKLAISRSFFKKEDKNEAKEFIKNLESISFQNHIADNLNSEVMKNILTAKIFATSRGSSPKMVLEWLSCVL